MRKIVPVVTLLSLVVGVVLLIGNREREPLPEGASADRVVIRKADRTLSLMRGELTVRTYDISVGRVPVGAKQREGDGRTPEGNYRIDFRKRDSTCHRALHISYPTPAQVRDADARGESPGGAIMIHGMKNGLGLIGRLHLLVDWTEGCVAVTNAEIEEIWRVVPDGTPVEILP